jgi:hypothetical protein
LFNYNTASGNRLVYRLSPGSGCHGHCLGWQCRICVADVNQIRPRTNRSTHYDKAAEEIVFPSGISLNRWQIYARPPYPRGTASLSEQGVIRAKRAETNPQ